jgi:ubiquinone/menaquinone biosynthesis C-methylase UbiE
MTRTTPPSISQIGNRDYWNQRYQKDPLGGSGPGSRGQYLSLKIHWIRQVLFFVQPETVLDIGCGDMRVGRVIPNKTYTGVDVSDTIIEENQRKHPYRRFIHGKITEVDLAPYDLTMMFDVSFHQPTFEDYEKLISRMVELSGKGGIIAGLDAQPQTHFSKDMFYYEPLTETLARFGVKHIFKLGEYRETSAYFFIRDDAFLEAFDRLYRDKNFYEWLDDHWEEQVEAFQREQLEKYEQQFHDQALQLQDRMRVKQEDLVREQQHNVHNETWLRDNVSWRLLISALLSKVTKRISGQSINQR